MKPQPVSGGHASTRVIGLVAAFLVVVPFSLSATWSIVAVDHKTGQVGSAGASYSPAVWPILGIVGGKGVIVAQASSNLAAKRLGMRLMRDDVSPQEIIARLTDQAFDTSVADRQYGIATLHGGTAAYTGDGCAEWAGSIGTDTVMFQGNILTSSAVLDDALAAYGEAQRMGLPLGDRLIAAMNAASAAGGDSRGGSATAMTAYLAIASPDDPPGKASYAIVVPPPEEGVNPVSILASRYEATKGRSSPMRFPTMPRVFLLMVVFPVLLGYLSAAIVARRRRDRIRRARFPKAALAGAVGSLGAFYAIRATALGVGVAVPLYGALLPIFLAVAVGASVVGITGAFVVGRLVFLVLGKR